MVVIVKVDVARVADPAAHVERLLAGAAQEAVVEEVFPGLRDGASAGLVSVRLRCLPGSETHLATLAALRADAAVAYVADPKPRRAR